MKRTLMICIALQVIIGLIVAYAILEPISPKVSTHEQRDYPLYVSTYTEGQNEGQIEVEKTVAGLSSLDGYTVSGNTILRILSFDYTLDNMFMAVARGSDSEVYSVTGTLPEKTKNVGPSIFIEKEDLQKEIKPAIVDSKNITKVSHLSFEADTLYTVQVVHTTDNSLMGIVFHPLETKKDILLSKFNGTHVKVPEIRKLLGLVEGEEFAILINTPQSNPRLYWNYNTAIDGAISLGKTQDANSLELVQVSLDIDTDKLEGEFSTEMSGMDSVLTGYHTDGLNLGDNVYRSVYMYSKATGEVIGVVLTAQTHDY